MNIIIKELQYFLSALKKFWVCLLIPALLSVYMYIIAEKITVDDLVLAEKLFSVFSVSYDILKIVLNVFWPVSFIIIVLYMCKLHFKMKIRKKTVLFLVLAFFIFAFFTAIIDVVLFRDWLFRYRKYMDKINNFIVLLFSILLFPFCVFKIKDIIKINIIFIKKYFIIVVLLVCSNIILNRLINKIATLAYIKFISMYTFSNLVEDLTVFLPILTIIAFRRRKLIQANLFKLLMKIKNKLHK
jgi:hypothetical protein